MSATLPALTCSCDAMQKNLAPISKKKRIRMQNYHEESLPGATSSEAARRDLPVESTPIGVAKVGSLVVLDTYSLILTSYLSC
jgi:hypothetical protein